MSKHRYSQVSPKARPPWFAWQLRPISRLNLENSTHVPGLWLSTHPQGLLCQPWIPNVQEEERREWKKKKKRERKGWKFKLNCLVMESPFQVSLILYLDSIECVPREKKERLNPSIRSGKAAQSSSLRDGLVCLQCRSVNTQDASRLCRPLLSGLGIRWPWEGACRRKLAHKVIVRSPRKCKMVSLPRDGPKPYIHISMW